MAQSRKPKGKPGRKSGARVRQSLATMPLGMKGNDLEIKARMSLVSFGAGFGNQDHAANLVTLAELCRRLTDAAHVRQHAESVFRLFDKIVERNWQTLPMEQASLEASCGVLIEWFHAHANNIKVAKLALSAMREIERRQ